MKVLVLGAGGREHALVWRLARDPDVDTLLAAPGNPGIAKLASCLAVDPNDAAAVLHLVRHERVDLTVVGPEAPLTHGVTDLFRDCGYAIVGPSQSGSALESSKAFAKNVMARARIPTARFAVCSDLESALAAVNGSHFGFPVVVKADGLAAGKGVVIAGDRREAEAAVRAAMVDRQFGAAGGTLVIEECLTGPEVSFFVLSDGDDAIVLGSAQDHKRIGDDDQGPNTGGMGAFAPSPLLTPALEASVLAGIVRPVLRLMREDGDPYRGFLYVSLMLTATGPKVIEFNVRFGDPEAQALLPLIEGPFAQALMASAMGGLREVRLQLSGDRAVGVVLASRGYPASSDPGRPIAGLDTAEALPHTMVFHAGTKPGTGGSDGIVTAGGRVLTIVGRGGTFSEAMTTAYAAVGQIQFEGMQYRRDIGRKAVT